MELKTRRAMLDNLMKILKRGKFELEGEEVVVFYHCMDFVVKEINTIDKIMSAPPPEKVEPEQKKSEEPKSRKSKKKSSVVIEDGNV